MAKGTLKILMLGWEFPPILSGGLGQACFGLANALSSRVELTLILPKRHARSRLHAGQIIGLNQLNYDDEIEKRIEKSYKTFTTIKYVDASFDLYPIAERKQKAIEETHTQALQIEHVTRKPSPLKALFNEENIYGPDIIKKVDAYARVVTDLAKDIDFDIVHAHDWITLPTAMMLKEKYHKPYVAHIHSLETDRTGTDAQNKVFEIEQKGMEAAAFVFCVSNYTRSCITRYYKTPIEKLIIVHNGIEQLNGIPKKTKPEKAKQIKKVLFLGRITRQKGPGFLVETAIHLLKRQQNIQFIVAGIGDRLRHTMQYAKDRGILEHFKFLGFLDKEKVNMLLAESDVYFMPSVSEPFGLSALEAAQADLPVVTSKQAGVNEVLPEVLKANFWDTATFANYLYALLNYEGLSQEMSKLTKKAIPAITWIKAAEDICYYYNLLVETPKPRK